MAPVDAQNSAIPGAIPPKWEKTCLSCDRTAMQKFTPIGKAQAEKNCNIPHMIYIWLDSNLANLKATVCPSVSGNVSVFMLWCT